MYQAGMLCKHFKGENLIEKNIYRIEALNVLGKDLDESITYTGDGDVQAAEDLVVYANIFQDNKLFAREESSLAEELSEEKKIAFGQTCRVEPLSPEEISLITRQDFINEKMAYMASKYQK